jgi:RNA polymerase sigma-70 factor (ECF subfamily)
MLKVSTENSEQILISALKRGEGSAYTKVLNLHKQQIANTVIGMLGAIPEAEDVGQEVFIRFFRNIQNFKGEAKISTYLTRIAINLSLNELERRKRKRKLFYTGDYIEEKIQNTSLTESLEQDERIYILRRAILLLDKKYREVIVLRTTQTYSFKEIAAVLDLPIGTVLTRYSRAQKKLTKLLNK